MSASTRDTCRACSFADVRHLYTQPDVRGPRYGWDPSAGTRRVGPLLPIQISTRDADEVGHTCWSRAGPPWAGADTGPLWRFTTETRTRDPAGPGHRSPAKGGPGRPEWPDLDLWRRMAWDAARCAILHEREHESPETWRASPSESLTLHHSTSRVVTIHLPRSTRIAAFCRRAPSGPTLCSGRKSRDARGCPRCAGGRSGGRGR